MTTTIIKANASLSDPVAVGADKIVNIVLPAVMQGSTISFQASPDLQGTYQNVYTSGGSELSIPVTQNTYIVDIPELVGVKYIKVRTGTAAAAVVQNADRIFGIEVK